MNKLKMSVNTKLRFVLINLCFVLMCNAQVDYFNSANWECCISLLVRLRACGTDCVGTKIAFPIFFATVDLTSKSKLGFYASIYSVRKCNLHLIVRSAVVEKIGKPHPYKLRTKLSPNKAHKDYQDPHSFYYDKHTKKEILPSGDSDSHEIGNYNSCDASECYKRLHKCKAAENTDVADELLSRRIVNIIIARGQFKKDGSLFNGRIELEASVSELEALKNFGLGKLTLREVDPIINRVIHVPAFDIVHETTLWIHTAISFLWDLLLQISKFVLQHKEYAVVIAALPCSYYCLRRTRLNFWIILTVCIQLIFVVSFFITYWRLIQEAKIKHTAAQMKNMELPVQCQPHKMGFLDKLRSFFITDDCEKYFEAVIRNPLYEVTPAQALAHMLANSMFEPVAAAGKTISIFLQNVTGDMPWLLSWIIQSAVCLGFFPVLILFIILLIGGTLNLGFGPFSLFSLRGPQSSAPRQSERLESKKKREPIEVMLNVLGALLDNK